MKRREPVSHIMTKNVHSVLYSDSLKTVADAFKSADLHHLPVKKGNEVVGIISSSDFNRLTFGKLYDHQEGADQAVLDSLSIDQVMTHNPLTVNADDSIKEVAEILGISVKTVDNHLAAAIRDVLEALQKQDIDSGSRMRLMSWLL